MFRRLFASLTIFAAFTLLAASAHADGLIVVSNPPTVIRGHFTFAPLEVTYHKVDCDIQDQVAVTSVDQEFYNPNNARLEGEYIFPVPLNAHISKFAMDIDGKTTGRESSSPPTRPAPSTTKLSARPRIPPSWNTPAVPCLRSTSFPSSPTAANASSSNTPNCSSRTTACWTITTPSTPKNSPCEPLQNNQRQSLHHQHRPHHHPLFPHPRS